MVGGTGRFLGKLTIHALAEAFWKEAPERVRVPSAKRLWTSRTGFPSTTGHEKPCGKLGGPSSKAKHYLMTDSELVPRGKGEKYPGEGSEIVPETVCLQSVGGR